MLSKERQAGTKVESSAKVEVYTVKPCFTPNHLLAAVFCPTQTQKNGIRN
jgi:hypothetical protein